MTVSIWPCIAKDKSKRYRRSDVSLELGQGREGLKGTALELFGGLAASYERALNLTTLLQDRYWKKWVAEETGAGRSDLVLDVGCGTLLLEERLASRHCTVVGLDLTERMLRIGKTKRLPNVPLLVHGDAEDLPFPDGSFDVVASCYVAKYVNLEKFAAEVSRVAKPGARIVLYDFVRPGGPFLPFLALYLDGAIRITGWFLGLIKSDVAFTFKNLPRIVEGATWDGRLVMIFEKKGVRSRVLKRLSGGVVAAYSGVKRQPDMTRSGSP